MPAAPLAPRLAPLDDALPRLRRSRRGTVRRRKLLAADAVAVAVSFWLFDRASGISGPAHLWTIGAAAVVLAPLLAARERDAGLRALAYSEVLARVVRGVAPAALVLVVLAESGVGPYSARELLLASAVAALTVPLARVLSLATLRARSSLERTVVVGAGEVGRLVARKLARRDDVEVVGFVDGSPPRADPLLRLPYLGTPAELPALVTALDVDRVVIAFSTERDERITEVVRSLDGLEDVRIEVVPRLFEVLGVKSASLGVEGVPLVNVSAPRLSPASRVLKRALDLALALCAVVVLAPFLLLAAALIKLDAPGPVLFRQRRVGRGSKPFEMYKFRTMVADADGRKAEYAHLNKFVQEGLDARMFKLSGDPRVTRIGRFLRRHSLDELPQLINVLRGDMSLVGPRPLVPEEDEHVERWARRRLDVRPGMTGLWQVLGRNDIPFDEMVRLDYQYVREWSLGTDLLLLARTVPVVLRASAD
jgi:exopolysaccharide biosynthesis polyprenyl glycosylphosphotransferase